MPKALVTRWSTAWAGWRGCSWRERYDAALMALAIPFVAIAMRLFPFRVVLRSVRTSRRRGVSPANAERTTLDCTRAVRRARRYGPYAGTCLAHSLALVWLLQRRGVDAELCLGARVGNGRLAAHAWVESGGRVINDTPDVRTRFAPFGPIDHSRVASWT